MSQTSVPFAGASVVIVFAALLVQLLDAADVSEVHFQGGIAKNQFQDATNARIIFEQVWGHLASKLGGEVNINFPKEITWLNGAPGAGKSTNTDFIKIERSIASDPLVVSSLLSTPELERVKANGFLVSDRLVTELLFEEMVNGKYEHGIIVDGYPRSPAQAAVVKILHDRLTLRHRDHKGGPLSENWLRPVFRIVILYVEESASVYRQMSRARLAQEQNQLVAETGHGELVELRATDLNETLARLRYKTFLEKGYEALKSLGNLFTYNLINAAGSLEVVRANIKKEMEYQSSIELNPETYEAISDLDLASEVTLNARQRLVRRLDRDASLHPAEFKQVIEALRTDIYPEIHMHGISGRCSHVSHNPSFLSELQKQMAIDILSERGFRVSSEPVVRGVKFEIKWSPPDKLGSARQEKKDAAQSVSKRLPDDSSGPVPTNAQRESRGERQDL